MKLIFGRKVNLSEFYLFCEFSGETEDYYDIQLPASLSERAQYLRVFYCNITISGRSSETVRGLLKIILWGIFPRVKLRI